VAYILQSPNPPSFRGVQMVFQDLSERFRDFPFGKPHHKFLNFLSRVLQMKVGRIKVLIT
jgi:formate dehydrogenase maturation protein FdhE